MLFCVRSLTNPEFRCGQLKDPIVMLLIVLPIRDSADPAKFPARRRMHLTIYISTIVTREALVSLGIVSVRNRYRM